MRYNIDRIRDINDQVEIIGWCAPEEIDQPVFVSILTIDNKEVGKVVRYSRPDVAQFLFKKKGEYPFGYVARFPKELIGNVKVVFESSDSCSSFFCNKFNLWKQKTRLRVKRFAYGARVQGLISYIDSIEENEGSLTIVGWAIPLEKTGKVWVDLVDQNDNIIESLVKRVSRVDVDKQQPKMEKLGFRIEAKKNNNLPYTLILSDGIMFEKVKISDKLIKKIKRRNEKNIRRSQKIKTKTDDYMGWYKTVSVSKPELMRQEKMIWKENSPKFSIAIPLYKTKDKYLKELIESLLSQTYKKFEVCFADASPNKYLEEKIKEYSKNDKRFLYKHLDNNIGIAENQNEAILMGDGEFTMFVDHDDILTPDALYEFACRIEQVPETDIIYSDEDKLDENNILYDPHFKPDFNMELLHSQNYISHLTAVRSDYLKSNGLLDGNYNGCQDFELLLRLYPSARKIEHIPKVLYHWRAHRDSTASNPDSKVYAFENGIKAVRDMWKRTYPNIQIEKVEHGLSLGAYHTVFKFEKQDLVSVIIPNKDHIEDLDKAIRSQINRGTWENIEFIIVENNSENKETFEYYEKIQKEFENVKVIFYKGPFNYSKINNFGVKFSKGKYLLFMNNDIELNLKDSVSEMVGYCQRDEIGICGCRLLYDDDSIQHAGVIIGINGVAGHAFKYLKGYEDTYYNRELITQNYSAVTAAVLMVRKDVFESIHGFDENFAVAFNDIDFCLRVIEQNKLIVYAPYACYYHYESKSRGAEDTKEKQERFKSEVARFVDRWEDYLKKGDPYYNPNLTLKYEDFRRKELSTERIGKPFYSENTVSSLKQYLRNMEGKQ